MSIECQTSSRKNQTFCQFYKCFKCFKTFCQFSINLHHDIKVGLVPRGAKRGLRENLLMQKVVFGGFCWLIVHVYYTLYKCTMYKLAAKWPMIMGQRLPYRGFDAFFNLVFSQIDFGVKSPNLDTKSISKYLAVSSQQTNSSNPIYCLIKGFLHIKTRNT